MKTKKMESDPSVKHSFNVSSGKFEAYLEKCTSYVAIYVLILSHAFVHWFLVNEFKLF